MSLRQTLVDALVLVKARIALSVGLSAACGYLLYSGRADANLLLLVLGTVLLASSAAVINELEEAEAELLPQWKDVRLWPYAVEEIVKGQSVTLSDMFEGKQYVLEDSAASRRLQIGEVLVAHLVPAGKHYFIGGAAAHLTADTRERLREYAELYLQAFQRDENPDAGWRELIRDRSEVLNHFVMQLPVEQVDPTLLDTILLQTRVSLQMAGASLGLVNAPKEDKPAEKDD